jgi:hypothetical protein
MKALAFCVVWFLIVPPGAYGDGCIIPPTAFAKVQIPDQRALIRYDQGMETLVIDTSFKGNGTNFAWIVPVPSAPKVEIATTGLFPTLQTIFQPEIIHNVPPFYWLAIVIGAFLFTIFRKLRRGEPLLGVLLGWLFALLFFSMLLPAGLTAGVRASAAGQVNVIEKKRVGVYDTAVLSSRDGGALLDWLSKNGFVTPTNFIPAIHAYAKEGWFFVASKIKLDASLTDPAKPSPLALTFKTERPVYPLRLTGIGNETCRIDLYVFGPGRAEIPSFAVERCAQPLYPATNENVWRPGLEKLRIRHLGLRMLVDRSPVATKLTARLTSQQMKKDPYISWSPFHAKRLTFYSDHGAAVLATNFTVPFMAGAFLIIYWFSGREGPYVQRIRKRCVMTVCGAVLFWLPIYLLLPKTPVIVQMMPERMNAWLHQGAIPTMLEKKAGSQGRNFTPDIAWVRNQLGEPAGSRQELGPDSQTNFFTGQPWHEEDSPGNWTTRQTVEGIEYVWYDIDGGEHAIPLFREKK